MYAPVEKPKENKSIAKNNTVSLKKVNIKKRAGFTDDRKEPIVQGKSRNTANICTQTPASDAVARPVSKNIFGSSTIQGKFILSDGSDLKNFLLKHGMTDFKAWFVTMVKPNLLGVKYGVLSFLGMLDHESEEYTMPIKLDPASEFNQAAIAVASALISHKLVDKKKKGIGRIEVVGRSNFEGYVTDAFRKAEVMSKTKLDARDVHLRHFVMGSWFRALPDLVLNHTDYGVNEAIAKASVVEKINKQIAALSPSVKGGAVGAVGDLKSAVNLLSDLLHDLPHNLNLGEGPENSIIGLASHTFSNIAFKIKEENLAYPLEAVRYMVGHVLKTVGFVSSGDKMAYVARNLQAMLGILGSDDPVLPSDGFEFFNTIAYNLGMDFMKYDTGMASSLQTGKSATTILELQKRLLPLGATLNSFIMNANWRDLDFTELIKLLNAIDVVADFVKEHPV